MWDGFVDWWNSVKEKRVAEEEASQDASLSTNGRNLAAPAPPKASGYLKKLERRADKTYQWALRHVELKPAQQLLSYAEKPDAPPLALLPLAMLTHVRSAGECDVLIGSRTETIRLRAPSAGAQKVWVRALSRALASVHSVRTSSARSTNSLPNTETLDAEAVAASPGEPFPEKGGAPEVVDEQPSSPADRWRRARSAPSVTASGARLRTPPRTPPSNERSPNAADVPARAAATSPSPLSATAVPAKSPSPRRTDVPVGAPAIGLSSLPAASRAESHNWHLRGQSDAAAEPSSPTVATACDASSAPDLDPSEKGMAAAPILAELELAPSPPPMRAVADNGAAADDGDAVGNGGAAANNGDAAANDGAAAINDEATSNDEITTATEVASPLPLHPAAAYLGTSEASRTELLYRYGTERKREKAASGPRTLDLDAFDYDNHAGIARGRDSYLHSGRSATDASAERELARATFTPTLSARSEQLASSSSSRAHGGPWWERHYKTAKTDDDIEELRRRVDQETGVTHSPIISPLAASLRRPGRVEERLFSDWHEVQQWREEQFESRERAVDRAAQEARRGRLERLNGRISSATSDSPAYLRLFEQAAAGKSPRPATASPPRGRGSSEKQARSSGNLTAQRSAASSRSNDTPAIFERLHDLALEEQAKRRRAERDEAASPRRAASSPGKAATTSGKASPRAQVAGASVDDSPCKRLYEAALEQRSRKSERVRQSQVEQERELASHPLRAAKASAAAIGAAVGKMHAQAATQLEVREARAKQSRQALDQEAAAQVHKTAGRSPIKGKLLTRLHEQAQQQQERRSQRVLENEQERRAREAKLPFAPVITRRGKCVEGRAVPKSPSSSPTKASVTQRM